MKARKHLRLLPVCRCVPTYFGNDLVAEFTTVRFGLHTRYNSTLVCLYACVSADGKLWGEGEYLSRSTLRRCNAGC